MEDGPVLKQNDQRRVFRKKGEVKAIVPEDIPFSDPTGAIDQLIVSRDIFAKLSRKKAEVVRLAPSTTEAVKPKPLAKPASTPLASSKVKTGTVVLQFPELEPIRGNVQCYTHCKPNRKYEAWLQAYSSFTDDRELAAQKHKRHKDGKTVSGLNFLCSELGPREEWGSNNHKLNTKQDTLDARTAASRKATGKKGAKPDHLSPRNFNVESWTCDSSTERSVQGFKSSPRPPTYVELLSDHWKCLRADSPPILGYTEDDIPDYEELVERLDISSVDHTDLMLASHFGQYDDYVQECMSLKDVDREEPLVEIVSVGIVGPVRPPAVEGPFKIVGAQWVFKYSHTDVAKPRRLMPELYDREQLVAYDGKEKPLGYSHEVLLEVREDEEQTEWKPLSGDNTYRLWLSAPDMMYYLRQRDEETAPLDPENILDDGWCAGFAALRDGSEMDRSRLAKPELIITKAAPEPYNPIHPRYFGAEIVHKAFLKDKWSIKQYANSRNAMRKLSRKLFNEEGGPPSLRGPVVVQTQEQKDHAMELALKREDDALGSFADRCLSAVSTSAWMPWSSPFAKDKFMDINGISLPTDIVMVGRIAVPKYAMKA